MAHINKHPKCRSRATAAVAGVLRCRVLGAHRLPGRAGKHHGQCDNSEKCNLVDDHGSKLCRCGIFAAQPTLCGNTPHTCTCFSAIVQTNI